MTHGGEAEKGPGLDSREGHVLVVGEAKVRYKSELKGTLEVKKWKDGDLPCVMK